RVYYKNLYLYTTCFIAGSVAVRDTDECAEGATVLLIKNSKKTIAEAVTNNYGDFKLDGLTEQGGQYRLEIAYPGYEKQVLNIELEGSMNLGTIFF
ncbi:MAG: carboxypeptidase regulatory-like domain-containing protein, partial [Deltaproteobacteria bacterium]|nr:carboxypeptidase regulatory-like domain-containing protein [Deltaproteobacteria bacterium]